MEESTRPAWVSQKSRDKIATGFSNSGAMHGDKLNSLVTMAQPNDESLEHSPIASALKTAQHLGRRVAEVAQHFFRRGEIPVAVRTS